jgi:oligopeptide/dipeptide ABC transporter ATP-binding protein
MMARAEKKKSDLPIKGETPQPKNLLSGCSFNPRCPYAFDQCFKEEPELFTVEPGHRAACFLYEDFHSGRLARGRLPGE